MCSSLYVFSPLPNDIAKPILVLLKVNVFYCTLSREEGRCVLGKGMAGEEGVGYMLLLALTTCCVCHHAGRAHVPSVRYFMGMSLRLFPCPIYYSGRPVPNVLSAWEERGSG